MYGYQQIYIHNGKLAIGHLDYQIFNENGSPSTLNYSGEAFFADGAFRITSGNDVYDFTVSKYPTAASVRWMKGFEKAKEQQRKRWPNPDKFSKSYIAGWQAGWRKKGR